MTPQHDPAPKGDLTDATAAFYDKSHRENGLAPLSPLSKAKPETEVAQMHADLRRLAITQRHRLAEGFTTVHVGWTCKVCKGDWDKDAPEFHADTCTAALTAGKAAGVGEEEVMRAMKAAGFGSKEIRQLTYTSWKDGIDIERPTTACMKFAALLHRPAQP